MRHQRTTSRGSAIGGRAADSGRSPEASLGREIRYASCLTCKRVVVWTTNRLWNPTVVQRTAILERFARSGAEPPPFGRVKPGTRHGCKPA